MNITTLREWQKRVHHVAILKGWYDGISRSTCFHLTVGDIAERLTNIHGEVSEAWEEVREGRMQTSHTTMQGLPLAKPYGFPSELADVVIRCMDLAEALGIDLESEIEIKHAYNETRPYRHGGKRA